LLETKKIKRTDASHFGWGQNDERPSLRVFVEQHKGIGRVEVEGCFFGPGGLPLLGGIEIGN